MNLNQVLTYFNNVKPTGNNQYTALCPAHNDHHPSLSIKFDENKERTLLHCFAGCTEEKILSCIGLEKKDLYLAEKSDKPKVLKETPYRYYNENGELSYTKTRIDYENGTKSFYFKQPNGNKSLKGVDRVPFNLPDVISASKVYIVEGEKCAEAVISAGRTATTFDSGSNFKWNNKFSKYFHEKEVVIIPDNDTPGLKYAKTIKDKLPEAKVVMLPELKEKEDIYDWLKAGHTMDEFDELPIVNIYDYFPEVHKSSEVDKKVYRVPIIKQSNRKLFLISSKIIQINFSMMTEICYMQLLMMMRGTE